MATAFAILSSMSRLEQGDPAPAFDLKDQNGRSVKLSDYAGRKLLVYFYPRADTPGCTKQSCSVRDAHRELAERGVDVVGISPDAPDAQGAFDRKYQLGFPLLADVGHAVADAWGAWGERSLYGLESMGITRSSFLVDEHGKVRHAWYKVKAEETVPKALEALRQTP